MHRVLVVVAAFTVASVAACLPCLALQVTISSTGSSFVQGEPIYIWIDYYNDTPDEVGVATRYLFGTNVVLIRGADGEIVKCAFEAVLPGPRGGNQVRRLGPNEHVVFLANLLDSFNLKDAGTYSIQISTANYKPELDLDKDKPVVPRSKLVQGRIESNRWEFAIAPGSGGAFELAAKDKAWGLFGLHHHAEEIVREYPDSPYAPYAMMEQVEQLLYAEGSGPQPLKDRLSTAEDLMDAFREKYSQSSFLNVAQTRYAERLIRVGEHGAATNLLRGIRENAPSEVARLYMSQLLLQANKMATRSNPS